MYEGINLAYGRKTGFGCYGPSAPMKRGARVFEATKEPWTIDTWVRSDGGDKEVAAQSGHRRVT